MYLSILALPMFGSAVAGLFGRKIGVTGAHIITTGCLASSAVLAIVAFYEVGLCGSPVSIELFSWIDSEFMLVQWGFLFDSLTVSMLLPVLVVSSLVHLYSISYMSADPHNQRFFSYLSMFTFFMLILVAGDNYFVMFIGWEGIGISSYLLINFWYTRIQANKSGIKALTVNRVGDMFLSIGFFAIFWVFGNVDYATVFSVAPFINETAITIIGLLLLIGAMAKSAQIGLHTWLPDSLFMYIFKRLGQLLNRGFSSTSPNARNPGSARIVEQPLSEFLLSFLVGLVVAGCLVMRRHKDMLTARVTIKITTTKGFDQAWLDYVYSLLSNCCYKGWSTASSVDNRTSIQFVTERATLITGSLGVLFPLYALFWLTEHHNGFRTLTQENLRHFNLVSLSAWIMCSGYWLDLQRYSTRDGLCLPIPSCYGLEECKLIRARLLELGVNTWLRFSQDRARGYTVLLIERSELPALDKLVGHLLIPSKSHLTKTP
jgi:hypothetical protein